MKKVVRCPQCKQETVYSAENIYRPFCSNRCQLIDLGEWAAGKYAIPAEDASDNEDIEDTDNTDKDNEDDHGPL